MYICIQSLGCPKNFVDSEVICGSLLEKQYSITNDLLAADLAIINTCSFIQPAVEESIEAILEAVHLKEVGRLKYIIVAGCLSQRYQQNELMDSFPEVDAFIGIDQISEIGDIIHNIKNGKKMFKVTEKPNYVYNGESPRLVMTPNHYAYLKISEGCNNLCTYCLIPRIKGIYRSRPIESILAEAQNMVKRYPLKELILIAEDTTYYGTDLYGKPALSVLLNSLTKTFKEEDIKIRILYTHPAHYTDELVKVIARNPLILPYLDVPLQHISDSILEKMNRKVNKKGIIRLIEKLHGEIPDLTIRTTFIVGFPGETDEDFNELCQFVSEYKFKKVGVFPFYREVECKASQYPGQLTKKLKNQRVNQLMKIQKNISLEHQQKEVGKIKKVLIDGVSDKNERLLTGRSYGEAPEIDGSIFIENGLLEDIGKWINVEIKRAYPYDLIGRKSD